MRRRVPKAATDGFSLIETTIALLLLAIVAAGVLPVGILATRQTENQGHLEARATEYAQDKLEQLMALSYGDTLTDTRTLPPAVIGGSGLVVGGTLNTAAPSALYVDYLRINGDLIPPAAGPPADWFYMRVWQITSPVANLKQITVTTLVRSPALGATARAPQATVAALKTNPF